MEIINCTNFAGDLLDILKQSVHKIDKSLKLAVVITNKYEEKTFDELSAIANQLDVEINNVYTESKDGLLKQLLRLNEDDSCSGIYLTKLSPELKDYEVLINSSILPNKDVGAVNIVNSGLINYNQQVILPPSAAAVIKILDNIKMPLVGKNVTIVNRTNYIGKPLANALLFQNCTVTVCHSYTRNLKKFTKQADLLISAIGQPNFINNQMVKKDAVVVDIGYSEVDDNIFGDVYKEDVENIIKMMNDPVGMHKLIQTFVFYNLIRLANI